MAVRGLLIVVASLVAEHRLALGRVGFRSCGTRAQWLRLLGSGAQAQWLCCTDFVVVRHAGSSWTGDETCVPCIGRRIPNHWTTSPLSFFEKVSTSSSSQDAPHPLILLAEPCILSSLCTTSVSADSKLESCREYLPPLASSGLSLPSN